MIYRIPGTSPWAGLHKRLAGHGCKPKGKLGNCRFELGVFDTLPDQAHALCLFGR